MPLITGDEILKRAKKGNYGIGAFNINNMEVLQGIVESLDINKAPGLIAVSEGAIKYAGFNYIISLVHTAADEIKVPIVLHLDHGTDPDTIKQCIDGGFTSVMVDGSHLPFEENIALTKKVVVMAKKKGVSVEAELGRLAGVEDIVDVNERDAILTDPEDAKVFVEKTGINSLAVAIGTSHGAYKFKGEAKLDLERLKEITKLVDIPLVLHGASNVPEWAVETAEKYGAQIGSAKGVPDDSIREAVKLGICKINIDTDLRLAMLAAVRESLGENPSNIDPRKYLKAGKEAIKRVVEHKIEIFGCKGKG